MEISIVIVNWNTKDLLLGCIKSIIASKPKMDYEVIVVDNGSTDGSVEALDIFKKKLNLKTIKNSENLGFAKANNQAINKSSGKYILLLNSDTEVKDDAITKMYNFAKTTDDAGVVGAKLISSDGATQPSCFHFPTLAGAIKHFWFGVSNAYGSFYLEGDSPQEVDAVVGACFLITPKARAKVGLINEKYFFFFEDLDYCRKVRSVGLKTYYLPSANVLHYHGSTIRKVEGTKEVWKKLIPGSKIYHGLVVHYLINFVIWTSQKWKKLLNLK